MPHTGNCPESANALVCVGERQCVCICVCLILAERELLLMCGHVKQ